MKNRFKRYSISNEDEPQEDFHEDQILRIPDWISKQNIQDLKEYEVSDDYIRGLFDGIGIAMDS